MFIVMILSFFSDGFVQSVTLLLFLPLYVYYSIATRLPIAKGQCSWDMAIADTISLISSLDLVNSTTLTKSQLYDRMCIICLP